MIFIFFFKLNHDQKQIYRMWINIYYHKKISTNINCEIINDKYSLINIFIIS